MDCRTPSPLALAVVFLTFVAGQPNMIGQGRTARTILDLSEADQIAFITATMEQGFPAERGEEMTMLIINRSSLTLPLIERKLEEAIRTGSPSREFVETAAEMISYAGNEDSLREIARLLKIDEKRFGRLIGRTLDNSLNWRNPFGVLYRGIEMGDPAIIRHGVAWSSSALASDRLKRLWAEALVDRYARVPSEPEWASDPIVSRLKADQASQLRETILRFASEAHAKRGKP